MTLSGKEATQALHSGNEMVFEQVFREYYERLCNYANTMINDMDEAEEIVQSTFLAVWEKRAEIEIHTSVKAYLYQSVYNQCLNRIKHHKVRQQHREHYLHVTDSSIGSVSDTVLGNELEQQIESAVSSLPSQCQTVFRLSRFENLTYAEISQQLNISVKTIENHMGKALKIMREKLKDYLPFVMWLLFNNNQLN